MEIKIHRSDLGAYFVAHTVWNLKNQDFEQLNLNLGFVDLWLKHFCFCAVFIILTKLKVIFLLIKQNCSLESAQLWVQIQIV